jgi:transcriptional regulator GlxA family with amidase domain
MRHMIEIGFYVSPGHQMLDLAGPHCAFQHALSPSGGSACRLHVLSASGGLVINNAGIGVTTTPAKETLVDTLVMVGGAIAPMLDPREGNAFAAAARRARRVASVCTGAFMLAELGLLDGRKATTHWQLIGRLQRDYPMLKVAGDCIFVNDGPMWTSAGITSGIDLALALIEDDLGIAASREVAKYLVVYHRRAGGQSQFSELSQLDGESDRIRRALNFAREHLSEDLPAHRLAEAACLSLRQFGRAFRRETAETPAKAVERLRVEAAKTRIEQGTEPIEIIARSVGFNDPERMRRAFLRVYGQPPQAIRRLTRQDSRAGSVGLGARSNQGCPNLRV